MWIGAGVLGLASIVTGIVAVDADLTASDLRDKQPLPANEVYAPVPADFEHAERIVEAYEHATSDAGGRVGAVMLGEEMIDEASRALALAIVAKGRAAGLGGAG